MAKPFDELQERLLRAGVAPRHVKRYIAELADHLADLTAEGERAGRSREEAESSALARLGSMDALANAMTGKREFQAWCARAPWAFFSLGPLFYLAGAWMAAIFILWSGWQIFLPRVDTPFGGVRVFGLASLYFQMGRAIYFAAPFFVGWGIVAVAVRQRLKALWPPVGLLLNAWVSGTAQIHASRTDVPAGLGHISMSFALGTSAGEITGGLVHVLVILTLTALPYFLWKAQQSHTVSA